MCRQGLAAIGSMALVIGLMTWAFFPNNTIAEQTTLTSNKDLSGKLTFDFVNWITDETEAIVDVAFPSTDFRRSASGKYGWRHAMGDLVYLQGCGRYVNRIVILRPDGRNENASPCSSEIKTIGSGKPQFEFSQLSPDKKHLAAELKFYHQSAWRYSVVVFREAQIVHHFNNFSSPTWLPDGRLVLSGNGLYVTKLDGNPKRIDDGWLGYGVVNADVSPNGEILVFEYNERLWIMDVNGDEHKELVWGPAKYRFPTWSPDGHYVAFLTVTGSARSEVDRALHFIDIRKGEFTRIDISQYGGNLNHVPFGPLSWTH